MFARRDSFPGPGDFWDSRLGECLATDIAVRCGMGPRDEREDDKWIGWRLGEVVPN